MKARQGRGAAAVKGQTRAYAERIAELVPVLRAELPAPAVAAGRPAVLVLMGAPGVGKSHCARLLCARLGAAHVSSDHLRSRLFIAASYTPEESATIFRCANALLELLLDEGQRVVLDATNLLASHRDAATAAARARGVPLAYVRVVSDEADVLDRLAARRRERGEGDHSDADETIYRRMRSTFEAPDEGHLELRNGPALDDEIRRVCADLEQAWARAS